MRAIVILALLAAICWALLFRGDKAASTDDPGSAAEVMAADAGSGFLMEAEVDASSGAPEGGQEPALLIPQPDSLDADPWAEAFAAEDLVDYGRLAGALLHLDPAGFAEALRRDGQALDRDRQSLYLAFSEALAGRKSQALDRARDLEASETIDEREWLLFRAALGVEDAAGVIEAGVRREGPMAKAMRLALTEVEADQALESKDWGRAARSYSTLLLEEIEAPWPPSPRAIEVWGEAIARVQANRRFSSVGEWPSVEVIVQGGDSLTGIRKSVLQQYPALTLCTGLIDRVNGLGGRYLQEGQRLRIPTDTVRTVVELDSRSLFVLFGEEVAAVFRCGIGASHTNTITGEFTVGDKQKEPMWFPRGKEPVPFKDPRNPLGTRWLGWESNGAKTSYGFHGTNDPASIGKAASEGCIRMHNRDVEVLYELLPRGSHVLVLP